MFRRFTSAAMYAGALVGSAVVISAQTLNTVTLPRPVMADGKRLAAGAYQVRLTEDVPQAGVGQSPAGARWVEFTRNGAVAGREVATVFSAGEIDAVAKSPRPRVNSARVEALRGDDYIRVWINRGKEHYLVHLPPAS